MMSTPSVTRVRVGAVANFAASITSPSAAHAAATSMIARRDVDARHASTSEKVRHAMPRESAPRRAAPRARTVD